MEYFSEKKDDKDRSTLSNDVKEKVLHYGGNLLWSLQQHVMLVLQKSCSIVTINSNISVLFESHCQCAEPKHACENLEKSENLGPGFPGG